MFFKWTNYKKKYLKQNALFELQKEVILEQYDTIQYLKKKLEIIEEYQKMNIKLDVYYDCYLSRSNSV
jgi:hypothetical protein